MESLPFRGLVETRPVKALAALRRAAGKGEEWAWAWNDFLCSEARGKDSPRFRCYLARRIGALPEAVLVVNLRAVVQWFTGQAKPVWSTDRDLYLATWALLASTIADHPDAANYAIVVQGQHDWISEALSAPAGRLAGLLFDELGWDEGPRVSVGIATPTRAEIAGAAARTRSPCRRTVGNADQLALPAGSRLDGTASFRPH